VAERTEGRGLGIFFPEDSRSAYPLEFHGKDCPSQKFQGYHHNIVAYTLAWLFQLTDSRIDLEKIWQRQAVDYSILDVLEPMAQAVNEHIRDTVQNVTEYCKREESWNRLKEKAFLLPKNIEGEYITGSKKLNYNSSISTETEAIEFCKSKGSQAWFTLSKWLKDRNFLTPKARSQCFNMGKFLQKKRDPSIALSIPAKRRGGSRDSRMELRF